MLFGTKEAVQTPFHFVEEALWPLEQPTGLVHCQQSQRRRLPAQLPFAVVERNIRRNRFAALDGQPNPVQHMIAVGLDKDLNTSRGSPAQKLSHSDLAAGVQMSLRVLNNH
jgi:hypothetical protein